MSDTFDFQLISEHFSEISFKLDQVIANQIVLNQTLAVLIGLFFVYLIYILIRFFFRFNF